MIYWYKYHAIHGGGHQQETTEYHWSDYKLTDDEEKEHLITWCAQFRNFKGDIAQVDVPPKEVVTKALDTAQLKLASAEHEVTVLRNEARYLKFLEEEKVG